MTNWLSGYTLGKTSHEERLREAVQHQRFVGSKRFGQLPSILQGLLRLLS
jgi:hypothetical protein